MARGNYDQQLPVLKTGDEIGRLGTAFNAMAREVARSHRAMRDLLANVSHDLRTPLTSIQGFAGALLDGTLSGAAGAREAGRVISEEAERMRRLVEDLLYLGRIESGEAQIERHPVDLAELASAARLRFAFRAEDAGVELRVQAPDGVPIVGDPHRLAQVLDNLLDNAFKHTPPGGSVTVSVQAEAPATGSTRAPRVTPRALLAVHNSGSVIPRDELDRVFERFYQLDKARAGKAGRGLGLAIAREIVQAHGGTISVESDAATGTSFLVRLPLVESSQAPRISSAVAVGRDGLAPSTVSNRH
jgi:two-component system sensor histidine kinase ResE